MQVCYLRPQFGEAGIVVDDVVGNRQPFGAAGLRRHDALDLGAGQAAAGHDPAVFEQPGRFDPDRANVRQHMGFGHGPHFCAGAELARLEARIAFETLLSRLADIELDEQASDLGHLPSFAARGYRRVALRFRRKD